MSSFSSDYEKRSRDDDDDDEKCVVESAHDGGVL